MTSTYEVDFNETHTWGRYRETQVADDTLLRVIEFHEGGRTSVHRHDVLEILLVITGTVRYLMGDDPAELSETILRPGDAVRVEPNVWHAAEYVSGNGSSHAVAVEYVGGDIRDGAYEIDRAIHSWPAKHYRPTIPAGK